MSTAPIKDLQQKCSSSSSSSKAVQAVSSSGVVHDPRCRPQDRPRPRPPRPSWYCRIAPYCVRWYHRGEQTPAPRQSTANQLLTHCAPAASTTPTRLLLQSAPSTPTTGRGRGRGRRRGRGRERSTTELEETSEPRMKSAFKKHCSALTPPERKSCFSSLSQRMILGVRHWQRLWPCSSLSDAAGNACTCSSRPSGIWATNRESGEWRSGGGQQPSQTFTPLTDTIQHLPHLQHLQQRQQVQQLFAMAEPTGSSLATSASAFVRYS